MRNRKVCSKTPACTPVFRWHFKGLVSKLLTGILNKLTHTSKSCWWQGYWRSNLYTLIATHSSFPNVGVKGVVELGEPTAYKNKYMYLILRWTYAISQRSFEAYFNSLYLTSSGKSKGSLGGITSLVAWLGLGILTTGHHQAHRQLFGNHVSFITNFHFPQTCHKLPCFETDRDIVSCVSP